MTDASDPDPALEIHEAPASPGNLASEDFYLDGPFVVFTSAYHLKRGFCCESNCRHCPYN